MSTELIAFLESTGALRFGDFTLKSGDKSPFFVNLGDVAAGRELHELGEHLARGLREHWPQATHIFGPAYKGIVLATATAAAAWRLWEWDLAVSYDRKEAKAHGEGGKVVGKLPHPGDVCVVVDDVFSSGGTKVEAVNKLRARGVDPVGVLVAVDRRRDSAPPVPELPTTAALATISDLATYLDQRDPARAAQVREFKRGHHV